MNDIERAEIKAQRRGTLFYLMAGVLILMTATNLGRPAEGLRLGLWAATMVLFAANLTPLAPMFPARLRHLINDETTREHRRSCFVAGFWAALAAALLAALATLVAPLAAVDVARVVTTAALAAALISFATLELRAQRG